MLDERSLWAMAMDIKEMQKGIKFYNYLGPLNERRKEFEKYPIYLKHTLLHDDENTKKLRKCDVSNRFMVFDKFREQGNKQYNKENFDDAMRYYERALGCFRWLDYIEPTEEESDIEEGDNDDKLKEEEIKEEVK